MKILNSKIHGLIDYVFVMFLFSSPLILGLPNNTSIFTYLLGCIHLTLTLLTNFEFGLIKLVPIKIHGWIELAVSFALIFLAFYLGEIENELSRNFYFAVAGLVFLTWILSDYSKNTKE
ncbi:hypothetical protein [Flavobacterium soyangense]|uniref:Uncharacterized protein n=1 Tax=Flavobacterium soyangense TaxID=2023265 RepID=A0A930XVP1_9FLAO|nr:hypothetical protein [Flavobacterium soyangense]MBF2709860.1 hypothetical protein [Flavobacterium soyangense]